MHLEITDLNRVFVGKRGSVVALKNINMHIETGEFVCAVGASGSGKSTLLRLIAGLDTPTSGTINVDGQRVTGPGADRGMVFQHYSLFPWMTVQENVEFGLKLQGCSQKERFDTASYYLDVVGLVNFAQAYPRELSGGMKQRVAIARSLACHPKVLLMDEPFGALDIQTKERMHEYLIDIWQRLQCSILMITHDVEEAVFLAQRVYVLSSRPGTIQRELTINLPGDEETPKNRTYKIKREPEFFKYSDEISSLLRGRETEETEVIAS
ncbi:ABC transporter ATP-binding protein [Synechocystis sp. CACIAM 05]|uniref:ABC transporter ATP-binding protein n=1 Tax=Synechocystis sp. CACIAM 05 TaxID=1933929 RepID=UPI00138E93C7|nr:ABC transporter ATP-binding protein [Synechocystis sp. CACIAM 05]QHU99330.1 nitrate ABC transporter ATP-binding protein [Synechocystis sp. CACIAM 05]